MAKIENMAAMLVKTVADIFTANFKEKRFTEPRELNWQLTLFQQKLKDLFKTHRNTVSTAVNQKDDKYSSRGETESKIAFKNSLRHHVGKLVTADQELDQIVENIVDFFLDTVNPVFRALNNSGEQSIIK